MSVMNDDQGGVGIPIDACYPSDRGIVARQTTSLSSHSDFGLTWIIGRGLRCEVWVPLNMHETLGDDCRFDNDMKYQNSVQFFGLLRDAKATDGKVLDLNQLWQILSAVLNKYFCLLDKSNTPRDTFHGKIVLSGVWRSIPFIDSKIVLDRMDKYGLPIGLTDEATVPGGVDADSFYKVKLEAESEHPNRMAFPTVIMMELICSVSVASDFEVPR